MFRSVVSQIVALHLLAVVAASICIPVALFIMLDRAANQLHMRALEEQADEIREHLRIGTDGKVTVSLPPVVASRYAQSYGQFHYAVLDKDGKVLMSSASVDRGLAQAVAEEDALRHFAHTYRNAEIREVTLAAGVEGHPLLIRVSRNVAHRDVLIDEIVAEFFTRVGWITAPILLLLLVIDVVIFRRAMRPIVVASARAEEIGPANTDLRLPENDMPREVLPLVRAVNQALDRLEGGFRAQREFTADAAHELRTPLAILRTQIDMIGDYDLAEALRGDVGNMSRLVNQLLEISELDTLVIGEDETADLASMAYEAAAFIAPLALSQGKDIAVTGTTQPVTVHGNALALARALRNLVENALAHTAEGTTVEIEVDPAGALRVLDRGPGVPAAERERIFRRFWRGDRRRGGGAGLGLSIVARIAAVHDAAVAIDDRPGGGAIFSIIFPQANTVRRTVAEQMEAMG